MSCERQIASSRSGSTRDLGLRCRSQTAIDLAMLRDLERMGQPRAVEIVLARLEDLRLGLQAAERGGEHDPVAVLVEDAAVVLGACAV